MSCSCVDAGLGQGKKGSSSSSSSLFLAAHSSVAPEAVCGKKGGFCPRDTCFRVCLASVPHSLSALPSTRMNSILNGPWHCHAPKKKPSAEDLWDFSGQKVGSRGERRGAVMLPPARAPQLSSWALFSAMVHVWSAWLH